MKFETLVRYFLPSVLVVFSLIYPKQMTNGDDLSGSVAEALMDVQDLKSLEANAIAQGNVIDKCTSSAELVHQTFSCLQVNCVPSNRIAENVAVNLRLSGVSRQQLLNVLEINNLLDDCVENRNVECDQNSKYRTIDASCNNLERPNEGRAGDCHRRLFPASYSDGIKEFRVASDGTPLPEPRIISLNLTRFICKSADKFSNFVMSFGQFLDHDFTITPIFNFENEEFPNCCKITHPECIPIEIFPDDLDDPNRTCISLVRSEPCATCFYDGTRQQINNKTACIDLAQVYGTNLNQSNNLRSSDGKLRVTSIPGVGDIPPRDPIENDGCTAFEQLSNPKTGDPRSSENPLLLTLHTVFLRYHNKLVDELQKLNPHWDQEILFQEARRILISIFQHIVYCSYLPRIIGYELASNFSFCLNSTKYDPTIPLVTFNEVTTAFFRFGHTTIPFFFRTNSSDGQIREVPLKDLFNNVQPIINGEMEDYIRGSLIQNEDEFDRCMSESITKFLYSVMGRLGLDLAAINIQRGRDNGIPSYIVFLRELNLEKKIGSFQDLEIVMDKECIVILEKVYSSIDDIDLFIGMLCENPIPGAVVGPTAGYYIGLQFYHLMLGDRFFFTHTGVFSEDQLKSIQTTSMSTVLCEVTNLTEVSVNVMDSQSEFVSCEEIPRLNLSLWKE